MDFSRKKGKYGAASRRAKTTIVLWVCCTVDCTYYCTYLCSPTSILTLHTLDIRGSNKMSRIWQFRLQHLSECACVYSVLPDRIHSRGGRKRACRLCDARQPAPKNLLVFQRSSDSCKLPIRRSSYFFLCNASDIMR